MKSTLHLVGLLVLFVAATGCDEQAPTEPADGLHQVGSYDIAVQEPSGLCFTPDEAGLYTVSDATNQVYRLGLDGTVLATLAYTGDDLEGVVCDTTDGSLFVVEERLREVVHLSSTGAELSRHALTVPGSDAGSGLEGITLRASDHTLFVVNEKNPARLFRLNADYSVAEEVALGAGIDYSGLYYDDETDLIWVVSDQAQLLFSWDAQAGVQDTYHLSVDKAEGVAIAADGRIYIVSDADDRLYVFEGAVMGASGTHLRPQDAVGYSAAVAGEGPFA